MSVIGQLYDAVLNMHLKPRSLFVYGKCNVSTYSLLETIFGLSLACDDDASDRMRTLAVGERTREGVGTAGSCCSRDQWCLQNV